MNNNMTPLKRKVRTTFLFTIDDEVDFDLQNETKRDCGEEELKTEEQHLGEYLDYCEGDKLRVLAWAAENAVASDIKITATWNGPAFEQLYETL